MITQDQIPVELRELAASIIKSKQLNHKAIITRVGIIADGKPMGFSFDCCGTVPGIEIKGDGQVLYGGYTVDELARFCSPVRDADTTNKTLPSRSQND